MLFNNPDIPQKLPLQYHKWLLLLLEPKEFEKLPDNDGCYHHIGLKTAEEHLTMGPIHQLTLDAERLLKEYLDTMKREGMVRPSSSLIESAILFVPKPNGKGLSFCFDYWHLNQNTVKDKPACL